MKRKREIGISTTLMQIRVPKMIVTFRIIICFVALFMLFFTLQLPDGYYYLLFKAENVLGGPILDK